MAQLKRITLPTLKDLRYRKVADTYYIVGSPDAVGDAVKAGGAWVMTGKGPRVILVDSLVVIDGSPAIAVQEPGEFVSTSQPATRVEDMSTEALEAMLAARKAGTVTSAGKSRTTSNGRGKGGSTSKPATTSATSKAATTAVQAADDDTLDAILAAS